MSQTCQIEIALWQDMMYPSSPSWSPSSDNKYGAVGQSMHACLSYFVPGTIVLVLVPISLNETKKNIYDGQGLEK